MNNCTAIRKKHIFLQFLISAGTTIHKERRWAVLIWGRDHVWRRHIATFNRLSDNAFQHNRCLDQLLQLLPVTAERQALAALKSKECGLYLSQT